MQKVLITFLALCVIAVGFFMFFEPQVMKAASDYKEFNVNQTVTGEITITQPSDVNMSPSIPGTTGGTSAGTTTVTVTTTNTPGYSLYLSASTSPALKSGSYFFGDYMPTNGTTVPEYAWWTTPPSASSTMGYTVEGNDTYQFFKDNGSICNAGSANAAYQCWWRTTTSNQEIAYRTTPATTGSGTTVGFKAQVQTGRNQESGSYTAKIGVTAVTN